MVNRVVTRENLLPEAKRLATIISRMPQGSVKLSKVAVRHTMDLMGMREAWFYGKEADILAHLVEGDEVESNIRHDQGVRAAIEWRRSKFLDVDHAVQLKQSPSREAEVVRSGHVGPDGAKPGVSATRPARTIERPTLAARLLPKETR